MSTEDVHRFGERVRKWRHDNRWTQQRLAEALGYDVSYIAKIEQGRRRPSRQFVARLGEILAPTGQELPRLWRQPTEDVRLPAPAASVVGRGDDIARVCALLRGPSRCVTLVGAPGVGKTSLALEVAWQLAQDVRHGACFVPLVDVADSRAVPAAVGSALGVLQHAGADPAALVTEVLRARDALVVLDNFEHVLGAAPFVEAVLREAPGVRLLITSREPLGVVGETVFRVDRLAFPDPRGCVAALAKDFPAVEVFVTRARLVRPGFGLTDANVEAVAEICARLDGLPLAIGLAASASAILSPADIARSLRHRLELPTGDAAVSAGPGRLAAALDWSWELLQPGHQLLLARLAAFSGGCTLAAAESVCGETGEDVLAGLATLARKNLVEVAHTDKGRSRFTLLETVRRFCLDRLSADGDADALRQRHFTYYLALVEAAAPHITGGPQQARWLRELEEDYANVTAALGWAIVHEPAGALRMAAALGRFFSMRRIAEGRRLLCAALDRSDGASIERLRVQIATAVLARLQAELGVAEALLASARELCDELDAPAERAMVVLNQGILDEQRGDFERAEARFAEAGGLSARLGDDRGAGHALNCRGVIALHRGDSGLASTLFLEALRRFRALDDSWSVAVTATNLGWIAETDDLLVDARGWYGESRQIWEAVGDDHGVARSMADMGRVARRQGDLAEASRLLQGALQVFQRLGDRRLVAACLLELAAVAAKRKRRDLAARLVGAADGLRSTLHAPTWPHERVLEDGIVQDLARNMDEAALGRARNVGRTLTVEDAVELAECGTWPPPLRRKVRTPAVEEPYLEVTVATGA